VMQGRGCGLCGARQIQTKTNKITNKSPNFSFP
jgi:hypothetical protein